MQKRVRCPKGEGCPPVTPEKGLQRHKGSRDEGLGVKGKARISKVMRAGN